MKIDLIHQRLLNQNLARRSSQEMLRERRRAGAACRRPAEVVSWLGAVQAQDYAGAKWALGQRTTGVTDTDVEEAFNRGDIIRTHVLRPTWHFVSPTDLRWMLALTGPRVNAVSAFYHRKFELDARVFARGQRTLERALQGGNQLTRSELASALLRAGIPATGLRLGYLMMHAELDQVICSGARRGNRRRQVVALARSNR